MAMASAASTSASASEPAAAPAEGTPGSAVLPAAGGPEIAFFDVETSVPQRAGQGYALLEFGAILVCPRRLVEVAAYATLVRPADPVTAVSAASVRCNGITRDAVSGAPPFRDVADAVYDLLNGRVWAGHNIVRFDSPRIREAFAEIGRPPPEPKGMIDTLPLLTQRFGRRAGDMKMASLANYFGLGRQRHRSLDDVRMNLEVLKYCATVLFLEASLPEVLTVEKVERAITRSQANGAASPQVTKPEGNSSPDSWKRQQTASPVEASFGSAFQGVAVALGPPAHDRKKHVVTRCAATPPVNRTVSDITMPDGGNQGTSDAATNRESVELLTHIKEMKLDATTQMDVSSSGYSGFIEPDDVSTECIKISFASLHQFGRRTSIQHKDSPLQLCGAGLKVQFGVNTKFLDNAGRPKLNIVVEIPENLSKVLEFCDDLVRRTSQESGSTSEWRALVKKYGYVNRPTVRLNIPTVVSGDSAMYSTDICLREPNGNIQKLAFSNVDAAELDSLVRGNKVDAFFALEIYDYQQNAGIRLVAKRLVVHSK